MMGELHYFVSRVLYLKFLHTLSFFLAHQCIENYLKGYLKQAKVPIPQIHDLEELLAHCKPIAIKMKADFLTSERVSTIILKYAPFYESARYPVQRTNPGSYVGLHPDDIKILDYFVFKMRDILPIKGGVFNGHNMYIDICTMNSLDFLELFKAGNINFLIKK
jgi:HEPN domain-containing protein